MQLRNNLVNQHFIFFKKRKCSFLIDQNDSETDSFATSAEKCNPEGKKTNKYLGFKVFI